MLGRVEEQPDDVSHLFDDERIRLAIEGPRAVGCGLKRGLFALLRRLAEPGGGSGAPHGPVRGLRQRTLQDHPQQSRNLVLRVGPGTAPTRGVGEPPHVGGEKAPPPMGYLRMARPNRIGDRGAGKSIRGEQDDLRPTDQAVR
jgi:hypothetical protein